MCEDILHVDVRIIYDIVQQTGPNFFRQFQMLYIIIIYNHDRLKKLYNIMVFYVTYRL